MAIAGGYRGATPASASTVISGTEASACETGQFCLASSAAWRNAGSSIPGTDAANGERDLRDPGPGNERHGRIDVELLGRRAGLREPVRERHREARCVRCRDELLGSRLAGGLARACVPAHGQRLERAAPDAIDRPAAFQQRSRPGDVRCASRPSASPFESGFDGDGRARPDERGERAALVGRLGCSRETSRRRRPARRRARRSPRRRSGVPFPRPRPS